MRQTLTHSSTDVGNLLLSQALLQVHDDRVQSASITEFNKNLEKKFQNYFSIFNFRAEIWVKLKNFGPFLSVEIWPIFVTKVYANETQEKTSNENSASAAQKTRVLCKTTENLSDL